MAVSPRFPRMSDIVAWHAMHTPDADAAVLDGARVTYAGLDAQVTAMARAMIAAGVARGDRVATLAPPSPDFIVAFIAAASIGAIWAGLNPKYKRDELLHPVRDSGPKLLLTRLKIGGRDYADDIAAMRGLGVIETAVGIDGTGDGIISMADFLAAGTAVTDAVLEDRRSKSGGREACLLVYTSGTTGTPKGALLHQQGIIDFALEQNRIWPVEPCRMLNYFPINHVGCTVDLMIPCVVAGGTTIFMEQFDAARGLDLMEQEGVTMWATLPAVFTLQLAEQEARPRDLSALKLIVWEGAPISEDVFDRLAAFGLPMATNYGQTESTSAMTATAPETDRDILLNSVGAAFPGVSIKLVDRDGRPVPDGEPGEVLAKSDIHFLGYWNRPEATAEAFDSEGYLRTGDLAVKRPDGRYRIVGRVREMYKSGGYNVYPREVEAVLEAHPAVAEAVVVPVPDPLWQEVGVAYVTLSAGATADDIMAHARDKLANYKVPKRLVIEADLPLLPIGKVDRVALRKRAETEAAA